MKYSKEELEEYKSENFKERLKFIDSYANWLKKTPNTRLRGAVRTSVPETGVK